MPLTLRKHGEIYHARGRVPVRETDGTITRRRIERSTGTGERKRARAAADQIEREFWSRAYSGPEPCETFAHAALTYLQTKGADRHIEPLLRFLGTMAIDKVDQDAALQACRTLYPGCTPATWNRQVFTPLSAVLRLYAWTSSAPAPVFQRPKGHDALPPLRTPDDDWFAQMIAAADPDLAAVILFLTLTGRRVGEAVSVLSANVDPGGRAATIERTKSGKPLVVQIPAAVFDALPDDWQRRERLFGYRTRQDVNTDLKRLAAACGLKHYSSHKLGRHAFSKRVLAEGHSLKFLKEAGHWKSIAMPARRYGHLERSEIDETVQSLGEMWGKKIGASAK